VRREVPALADLNLESIEVTVLPELLLIRRWNGTSEALAALHFAAKPRETVAVVPPGIWRKVIDSADKQWGTAGSPLVSHFESAGELTLTLPPYCVALFVRDARHPES
jgi:maltooligosyltrehalose trehalohydrolase